MNETPKPIKPRRRVQFKANLQRLRASRKQGMFGMTEILALGTSLLLLLLVVISYVYFLIPARSRLETVQLERTRLQTQLRSSQEIIREGHDTQSTVAKITQSLDEFQSYHLSNAGQGRMGLYGELNQLIRKNGLRNTAGPAYTPLLSSATKQSPGQTRSASTKWQSVYPGIAVSLTVEGQYQNLRRFIRDLEVSKQFIIVNAIELERATETNSAASLEPSAECAAQLTCQFASGHGDLLSAGSGGSRAVIEMKLTDINKPEERKKLVWAIVLGLFAIVFLGGHSSGSAQAQASRQKHKYYSTVAPAPRRVGDRSPAQTANEIKNAPLEQLRPIVFTNIVPSAPEAKRNIFVYYEKPTPPPKVETVPSPTPTPTPPLLLAGHATIERVRAN